MLSFGSPADTFATWKVLGGLLAILSPENARRAKHSAQLSTTVRVGQEMSSTLLGLELLKA